MYHPRIETHDYASFQTTRTRNSALWFINNKPLEDAILGYLAKFAKRYQVKLYAFAIEGSHTHAPAFFPLPNRADFMRDLNSCIARAVPRYVKEYDGGRFWGRRYSNEFLGDGEEMTRKFFYTVLQPVKDGLVPKISEYPGYNCFHDAVWGIKRKFKVVNWAAYNAARRWNKKVTIASYTEVVELEYERLPGYEHLSQKAYAKLMCERLEVERLAVIKEREARGLTSFVGRDALLKTKPGTLAKNPKRSTILDKRPRFMSSTPERYYEMERWYFANYDWFKQASKEYRSGNPNVEFPPGMYKPNVRTSKQAAPPPLTLT